MTSMLRAQSHTQASAGALRTAGLRAASLSPSSLPSRLAHPISAHSARLAASPRHLIPSRLAQAPSATASSSASTTPAQPTASTSAATVVDDFATDSRPVILFDGVCNLCNNGVNFMLDNDPSGVYRLAALQSPAGRRLLQRCGRSPDDISSIVLVERDSHYIRSEAILRIGWKLRVPLPLLAAFGFPVPLPLRDAFYDSVANNRYNFFGRTDSCRVDDGRFKDRFIIN